MHIPLLQEALSAREARIKEEKFKEARLWVEEYLQKAESANERYLLACLYAKGAGSNKPEYKEAGEHLLKLPQDYVDAQQPFYLHSEDLTRIAESNSQAAKFIFESKTFSERVVPEYLARIAEANDEIAEFILMHPKLSEALDPFDLARMGAASLNVANKILEKDNLYQKLDSWGLGWVGESRPELAKIIFESNTFSSMLDGLGVYRIGVRYKPIGKLILQEERFMSKLTPDQVQRLKANVEK